MQRQPKKAACVQPNKRRVTEDTEPAGTASTSAASTQMIRNAPSVQDIRPRQNGVLHFSDQQR
jgi:hypothetical protein